MEFSIGSWSFHELYESGQMNIFGYLQAIRYRYHLDSADIWTGMLECFEDSYIQKLSNSLLEEELSLSCLATDAQIWDDDLERREQNQLLIHNYLQIASTLRAKVLRIDAGIRNPQISENQFDYVVEKYRTYSEIARQNGFLIGPQTHQPATQVPKNIARLVETVASEAFGIIMDLDRWTDDRDIGNELCASSAIHVHFDSSRTKDEKAIERIALLLLQSGYSGCWSLEYRLGGSEYLGVARDLATLRHAVHRVTTI